MQLFINIFLIAFFYWNVKGENKLCSNDNNECNISEVLFSDNETTDLNTLVKHAIQYFNELNQKHDNKINTISSDIGDIKNSLKCSKTSEYTTLTTDGKTSTTTTPPSAKDLYDNLWIMIQRRQDGSISFFRKWDNYKRGFGNPYKEFFIGLDHIHALTNSSRHELLIKLEDFKGNAKYALYDDFVVGPETEKYQLKKLGKYSGDAGDYMREHEGMYFSTKDRDNDASPNLHCALRFQGGWWYNNCLKSNLNGPFRTRHVVSAIGITWGKFDQLQLQTVQMMLRSRR